MCYNVYILGCNVEFRPSFREIWKMMWSWLCTMYAYMQWFNRFLIFFLNMSYTVSRSSEFIADLKCRSIGRTRSIFATGLSEFMTNVSVYVSDFNPGATLALILQLDPRVRSCLSCTNSDKCVILATWLNHSTELRVVWPCQFLLSSRKLF